MKRSLIFLTVVFLVVGNAVAGDKKKQEPKAVQVDWQKLLADLRERFARSSDAALQQTRIDKAYFTINADDPDQPPFLNFTGVCLRTVQDDEKQVKARLLKELAQVAFPGGKYVVKIDEIAFHETPIYKLQDASVAAFKVNPTFNVYFERATYSTDGTLQLHVLCLRFDAATNAKIGKLVEENALADDLTRFPNTKKPKTPVLIRRDYDWLGARLSLQRQFALGTEPLLQRTRLDDGFLHYSKDRKSVHFDVNGVCIHPPALVVDIERAKRWKGQLGDLIPKVAYEPVVSRIVMTPNPSIAWQNDLAKEEAQDGVYLHLAKFDRDGAIQVAVDLPTNEHRKPLIALIQRKKAAASLLPIEEKNLVIGLWKWHEVKPRAQARLAEGDFVLHRVRLDRVFWAYDDEERGDPFLHIDGVSLHPETVEPPAQQRVHLEKSLADIAPTPMSHRWNSQRLRFLDSPIYAMQARAVAGNLDGLLFANGRYDAQGILHYYIALGTPAHREAAAKIAAATPIPAGVTRAKETPRLDFTQINWTEFLDVTQVGLARSGDTLLRKSRLDRGYFSYPESKIGPNLNLALVGLYPKKDIYRDRLQKHLNRHARLALSDQLRAGPVTTQPTVEHLANPATVVQTRVPEQPILDGVRLDDASFSQDKKLIFHGIWTGKDQQAPLEKFVREILTQNAPELKHGIHWEALVSYDIAGLLLKMRTWVADQDTIDEIWLERVLFDGVGKLRVKGFATRPQDKEKAVRTLADYLPKLGSKKLPAIDGDTEEKAPPKKPAQKEETIFVPVVLLQPAKDEGPFQLDQLPNIAQYLRDNIPKNFACDGLRIDRCFYDPKGVFRIEGLANHANQTVELKEFLEANNVPFDRKRQLAKGWTDGRQNVIPLRPMMLSLAENLPALAEFDGLTLTRAYHNPKNQLVLSGNGIGEHDAKELAKTLKRLLDTHPRWQGRTTSGVVVEITDKRKADRELAQRLTMRALHLLQVNIGEARIEPAYPTKLGWWSHAWPFDDKLPRVRPTDDDYDRAIQALDAAILHDTNNVLAWYLRGYCLQTKGRSDLSLRDFRRMVAVENDDTDLRHQRILDLELVQGKLRQSAFRIEKEAVVQIADGWTLRVLRESPAAK